MRDNESKLSFNAVILSLLPLSSGTVGGWLITLKIAGSIAGQSFLILSTVVALIIFMFETVFYVLSKRSIQHRMYYAVALSTALAWFMLSMFLPLMWTSKIDLFVKISISTIILVLCISNVYKGYQYFELKWQAKGAILFTKFFDPAESSIEWQKVVKPLDLSTSLYIPGIPDRFGPLVSGLCLVSMVLGVGLRTRYPLFSIFAWGIPVGIIVSAVFQMMGLCCAQASKISSLEENFQTRIKPRN